MLIPSAIRKPVFWFWLALAAWPLHLLHTLVSILAVPMGLWPGPARGRT